MKKAAFYSMMKKDNRTQAVKHDGYTDGTFYYYRPFPRGSWSAIHPENGLQVAYGATRKEAAAQAHAPGLRDRIAEALRREWVIKTGEAFRASIEEQEATAPGKSA